MLLGGYFYRSPDLATCLPNPPIPATLQRDKNEHLFQLLLTQVYNNSQTVIQWVTLNDQ